PSLTLNTSGKHQRDNAAAAICAARRLYPTLDSDAIRSRLSNCTVAGRQQLLPGSPDILLDVAHNPVSFRALAETLRSGCPNRRILAVIGMMKDKDATASLHELRSLVNEIIVVKVNSPRSFAAKDLCEIAQSVGFNARCADSLDTAFALLHNSQGGHDLGLVAGSFYLAGDYLTWRRCAGIA
ncbi:hypothetical protein EHM69_00250, partial [candidate division KSB1 bacterium]